MKPLLMCLPSEQVLLQNKIHRHWIENHSLETFSASELLLSSFAQKRTFWIFSVLQTIYHDIIDMSLKARSDFLCLSLIFLRKVVGFFKQPLEEIITISLREEECARTLEEFFEHKAIACLVMDLSAISAEGNEPELILKMRGIITRFARARQSPIFMITHGLLIRLEPFMPSAFDNLPMPIIYPDSISVANEKDMEIIRGRYKNAKRFMIGGDLRLDVHWMRDLEETAKKLPEYRSMIETPGKVVLYLAGSFPWLNNDALLNSIHADICGLPDKFPDLTVWVKLHPRYPLHLPFLKYRGPRVRIFGNRTDSNLLIARADIVISPLTGLLLQPMLLKRGAIFYDKIRAATGASSDYIYDYTDCMEKAKTPLELELSCKKILEGNVGNFEKLEEYYAKYISGGATLEQSMMGKYVDEVLRLCGESGRL